MPATLTPDDAPDPAHPVYDRQIAMLGDLAEAGLRLALTIERQAQEAVADAPAQAAEILHRATIAFGRASRAVRLTVMLQARLVQELEARDRKRTRDASFAANCAQIEHDEQVDARKAQVERIVERIAERQELGEREVERLTCETAERLETDDFYGDVMARPVSELVAMICEDLGLDPDWPKLAEEAWMREEMAQDAPDGPNNSSPVWGGGMPEAPALRPRSPSTERCAFGPPSPMRDEFESRSAAAPP